MFVKNIVKYIFILVLIIFGVSAIVCAIMMFVPSVSILGYRYVSVNENQTFTLHSNPVVLKSTIKDEAEANRIASITEDIDSIEIDAGNMNVMVYPIMTEMGEQNDSTYGYFIIESVIQGNGFCKASTSTPDTELLHTFEPEIVKNAGGHHTLLVKSVTIDGLINLTYHKLNLQIPRDLGSKLKNITVKTKNGDITIKKDATNNHNINDAVLSVSEIASFESIGGNIKIVDLKVNQLNATSTYGEMVFSSGVKDVDGGNMLKGVTTLKNEMGRIVFEDGVDVSNIKVESGISRVKINNVADTIEYIGESAYLEIGKVTGSITIRSVDAVVNIKAIEKISGKADSRFFITSLLPEGKKSLGNISFNIKKIEASEVDLRTNSGVITIEELITNNSTNTTRCVIESNTGNITIGKLTGDVGVVTSKGNVKINQALYGNDATINEVLKNSKINIQAKTGNIVLKNIVGELHLNVPNGGNAPIDISFLEINKNSEILAQKGVMKLHLPLLKTNNTVNTYNIAFFKIVDEQKIVSTASVNMGELWPFVEVNDKSIYYYIQNPSGEYTGQNALEEYNILSIYSTGKIIIDEVGSQE